MAERNTLAGLMESISGRNQAKEEFINAYVASQQAFGQLNSALYSGLADMNTRLAGITAAVQTAYRAWENEPDTPEKAAELGELQKLAAYIEPIRVYASDSIAAQRRLADMAEATYNGAAGILDSVTSANYPPPEE